MPSNKPDSVELDNVNSPKPDTVKKASATEAPKAAKNDGSLPISFYDTITNHLPNSDTLTNFNKAHPILAKVGLFAASATVLTVGALAVRQAYTRSR